MAGDNTNCCFCPPINEPPPPHSPAPGQELVDHLLSYSGAAALTVVSVILMVVCVQYFLACASRRLWLFPCYPAQFMALSAGPMALVGLIGKPLSLDDSPDDLSKLASKIISSMLGSALACTMVGACMPSIAIIDRRQMWSNVAGTAVLLMASIFNLLNYRNYRWPSDSEDHSGDDFKIFYTYIIMDNGPVAACLMVATLVLIVQAVALDVMMTDVAACVSIRSQQLGDYFSSQDARGNYNRHPVPANDQWSFEDLERKTCIKLMMALTSNSQNVASRSPISSVVLAAVCATQVLSIFTLIAWLIFDKFEPRPLSILQRFKFISISVCLIVLGFMCISRWARLDKYDRRSLRAILFHTHPFYWPCHKIRDYWLHDVIQGAPPACPLSNPRNNWQRCIYVLKLILYSIILIHQMCLVATKIIDFLCTLIFRALKLFLLIRLLILVPLKALLFCTNSMLKRCRVGAPGPAPEPHLDLSPGVVYTAGEDPLTVQKLFEACARHSIRTQTKRAETKSIKALQTLLKLSNQACFLTNNVVYEVLHRRAISDVGLLDERNHIYGWSLTIISLLTVMNRVEVEVHGTCKTSTAAMEAYEQAMKMVEVVDKMHAPKVCSIEVYLKASASMWTSLLNSSRSWQTMARQVQVVNDPLGILNVMLDSARKQIQSANSSNDVLPWPVEKVKAYTLYTVCYNLRKWCMDMKHDVEQAKNIIDHIQFLLAEVLTACLYSLPAVLETCTNSAVCSGDVTKIENAIFLIHLEKKIWKELQWPCSFYNSDFDTVVASAGFPLNEYWLLPNKSTSTTNVIEKKASIYQRHSWPRQKAQNYCDI